VSTAGHTFTFADEVGVGFAHWTSEIVQLNPAKSITSGSAWTSSGMFSNRFGGPQWEHDSGSSPAGLAGGRHQDDHECAAHLEAPGIPEAALALVVS
jgi:hypothetical protein